MSNYPKGHPFYQVLISHNVPAMRSAGFKSGVFKFARSQEFIFCF